MRHQRNSIIESWELGDFTEERLVAQTKLELVRWLHAYRGNPHWFLRSKSKAELIDMTLKTAARLFITEAY